MATVEATALVDSSLSWRLTMLYEEYAACLDDEELERWPSFFTDDAIYQVIARENHSQSLPLAAIYCDGIGMIRDRAAAIRQCTTYMRRPLRHLLGGVRVLQHTGSHITARANFAIFESHVDAEPRVLMVGYYLDTLSYHDGKLLFRERSCVYDNYRVYTTLLFPV